MALRGRVCAAWLDGPDKLGTWPYAKRGTADAKVVAVVVVESLVGI